MMIAGLWALTACDNDEPAVDDVPDAPGGVIGQVGGTNVVAPPTDWVVREDLNPTTAQPVVVTAEGLPEKVTGDDLLAAFIGGQCHAVASPVTDGDLTFFTLVVMAANEAEGAQQVELRYYSADAHRIYCADTFTLSPGERLGSLTEGGYAPHWK